MAELPGAIREFLNKLAFTHSQPAYLFVDRNANLMGWGGSTAAYGLADLRAGEPVGEQIYFLEGLFPLDDDGLSLPFIHTPSGRPADLHLFTTPEGDCALLLDATVTEQQQRLMQQKGNELQLSYQRLVKEIQKKDILLHCIVHDLAGPLMGIKGGFELLAGEPISDSGRKFLEIGLRQANKQETLIREILQAFSAELASLEAFSSDPEKAPDALASVREVIESLSPAFALNQVNLRLDPRLDVTKDWKVVGEKSRLDRVLSNLIENALRHSPANSTVIAGCYDEGDRVLVAVDDEGPGIPPELAPQLFQKFAQGKKGRGKIGLGLYFCRMTVEHWGGEIGHQPLGQGEQGGTRFWFRLPRPQAAEKN
ncbi:MAG: sensor histidine kinase [Blastocatellia bacterium]